MTRAARPSALIAFALGVVAFLGLTLAGRPAAAQDILRNSWEGKDQVVFGAGVFDIWDDKTTAAFSLEYRPGWRAETPYLDFVAPFVGVMANPDGAVYGYFGFGLEFVVADRVLIFPFTGVGAYEEGDSKDLGDVVEFRSGLELGYRFKAGEPFGGMQLGANIYHLSNAGLSPRNPGTEIAMVTLTVPFSGWFD